jgi:phage-related minor tail protein
VGIGGLGGGLMNELKGVPAMANGGIVTSPTLALIGEAGPEAVIPLDRAGGMGGINITVHAGLVSSPDQVGQQIIEAIQKAQRRSGPVFAPA